METKKDWWKPAIEGGQASCLCCPANCSLLDLDTKLYNGFGGWNILKNGQEFFQERMDTEFDDCKSMVDIENMIGEDNENEYCAVLFLPLRGGTWQRHAKNVWVLIEQNEGFA